MLECWATSFPNCDPLAHLLKQEFPSRWVRFHSLPQAKRYAESEAEYRVLADRHNAVLRALAGTGSAVIVLTTELSSEPSPTSSPDWPGARWWRTVRDEEGDSFWHVYADEVAWEAGIVSALVRRAAEDGARNVMICDPACAWVVHPYDGGMDVVLASTAVRDQFRDRFREWLSPRPDGM